MRRFGSSIGVQQGSRVLFSDFADGGQMWTGQGERESRFLVSFREAFTDLPVVTLGLSMWDIDHKTNSRVDLQAENVTTKGFHIVFRTWGDSRIARVRADWTAIGPVRDDDDWDVA
ncbi:H-type lectin domain-containing protein [Neotabrizicola sp. sgz301269]|uniref:H-type lectin domain-containing protein n=1 Tax=Neotabrizicola sp. sgz301269 TaxID=3276282 RepID=UPI003770547A